MAALFAGRQHAQLAHHSQHAGDSGTDGKIIVTQGFAALVQQYRDAELGRLLTNLPHGAPERTVALSVAANGTLNEALPLPSVLAVVDPR